MHLLQAASIVGRHFAVATVAAMVVLPVFSCLEALDEAAAAGLVEVGPTPAEHRFVHAIIRDAVEAGLATSERVRLHGRAAEAIEEIYGERLEPHLFDLARHWAVAAVQGDVARAAGSIRRAGEEAMRGLAFEETAWLFRLALASAPQSWTRRRAAGCCWRSPALGMSPPTWSGGWTRASRRRLSPAESDDLT